MFKNFYLKPLCIALVLIAFWSCSSDDDGPSTPVNSTFTVNIENVMPAKLYFDNGTIPQAIPPGSSVSISFNAGKGDYFNFATMFVQSNDLFFSFREAGLKLYNDSGNPNSGDVSDQVVLFDAGTEVNEEPGVGENQPLRQVEPNTGENEEGVVHLLDDMPDGFWYPPVPEVINVVLSYNGGTNFTVTITNVSANLELPIPFSSGVWVINKENQRPLFSIGTRASEALESLAEDGNNNLLNEYLTNNSGYYSPFAPGAYSTSTPLFTVGQTASSPLEALAEDGNPIGFSNIFNTPVGAVGPELIFSNQSYSFTFTAEEGQKLSFATMLVFTNDWFVGAENIDLFTNGSPLNGDITNLVKLYDAGTEVNQYPGAGSNQPPRQTGPNSGTAENGIVQEVATPVENVPSLANMVKVTVTAN